MKHLLYMLLLFLPLMGLTSCEDNAGEGENAEFTTNWQLRNAEFFLEKMNEAKTAIATAKATYGDDWADHCDWRIMRSYAKAEGGYLSDSICAKIVDRGEGTVSPIYTDSVKVNYMGRLMPTESYPAGRIFDHSGIYDTEESVFSPAFATPTAFAVSGVIEGFTTALQYMHKGDRWQVYIPQELAYQSSGSGVMPAYSTLMFDLQLTRIY